MMNIATHQPALLTSDARILAEIWNDLRKYQTIRAVDMGSFTVAVDKGTVSLTGHVSKKYHHDLIEEIARSRPGVYAVHNKLVVDSELSLQVARSLSDDARTREFIIPVGSVHGWIRLGSVVPSRELQLIAEEIAASVPGVRGVLLRPMVIGSSFEVEQPAIQPHINTKIYGYNRQEGVVTQVVIQPRNRLVTHVVVGVSNFNNGTAVTHEHVIPLESIEVLNPESLFVKRKEPPMNDFPLLDAAKYPWAPSDWQPPYPYAVSEVRWPCEPSERLKSGSGSV